jgi:probable phosphoglycerate mutase
MHTGLPQIWLVRHGETAWSLSGQHTGRTDIPLTERGEQDARALKARLEKHSFAKVWSSPSSRARRTGELAGFADSLEVDADLLEWNYGIYEGRRTADIRIEQPGWNPFDHGCPGGENLADIAVRAERLIAKLRVEGRDVLIFAHRDILRIVAALWASLPAIQARRLYLEPASISVLSYDHTIEEPIIRTLNT